MATSKLRIRSTDFAVRIIKRQLTYIMIAARFAECL